MANFKQFENYTKQYGKSAYRKAESINFLSLLKVISVVMIVVVAFVFGKSLTQKIKSWFGFGSTESPTNTILDKITGNDSNTAGNTHYNTTNTPTNEPQKGKIPLSVAKLVDDIYNKLSGWNVITYPSTVNKLANLSITDLKHASHYWYQKYKGATGLNFYQFIKNETSGQGFGENIYAPALSALKKTGYYGN